jgi:hypothetical protein
LYGSGCVISFCRYPHTNRLRMPTVVIGQRTRAATPMANLAAKMPCRVRDSVNNLIKVGACCRGRDQRQGRDCERGIDVLFIVFVSPSAGRATCADVRHGVLATRLDFSTDHTASPHAASAAWPSGAILV